MPWTEFQRRAGLEKWDRHAHWKLREGEFRWGPDRLIAVAKRLGIPVVVAAGSSADSLLNPQPAPPPPAKRRRTNAPDPRQFSLFGTDVPTLSPA
ncbi:hypothetical protein [Methylobacterium sp. MA0201]|uniref:hypothetical protein n=1 Tax=Methylobacterium alsaeris TaxID=3344826 RepID=UPI0037579B17